jgi:hypothetical protein
VTRPLRPRQAVRVRLAGVALLLLIAGAAAACGSSKHSNASTAAPTTTNTSSATVSTGSSTGPSALQGEAASVATGDIPDNQVFLRFSNPAGGYSLKYPEGWAQNGSGRTITFRDKNNIVRVVVGPGSPATLASARADLTVLRTSIPSLRFQAPQKLTISGAPAIKIVYRTTSAPNPVTNKSVQLTVDRYYLAHGGKRAVVDLGTAIGVDNVDAYRLMIESFRWK